MRLGDGPALAERRDLSVQGDREQLPVGGEQSFHWSVDRQRPDHFGVIAGLGQANRGDSSAPAA